MPKKATVPSESAPTEAAKPASDKSAQMAAARAAKTENAGKDVFVFLSHKPNDENKVAPQVTVILNVMEKAGKAGITRKDLVAGLEGVIATRQPISRIVSFYQKSLVERGLAEIRAGG